MFLIFKEKKIFFKPKYIGICCFLTLSSTNGIPNDQGIVLPKPKINIAPKITSKGNIFELLFEHFKSSKAVRKSPTKRLHIAKGEIASERIVYF